VFQIVGSQVGGAQNVITVTGSTDPQVDTIVIYRSTDGFSASGPYLELTEVQNPPPVNGLPGTTSVIDFMPDLATATLPGLNPLEEAPIDDVNDPPPGQFGSLFFTPAGPNTPTVAAPGTGMIGTTYHQGRLWGFVGNNVFCSGGPDTNPGNGFTAWPSINVFPFQSQVIRLVTTTNGILVFTTTDLYVIGGGPGITTYFSSLLIPNFGILSWNAVTQVGSQVVAFTSDNQLVSVDPQNGFSRIGHPIGNLLAGGNQTTGGLTINFNPANVYLAYHSSGDSEHALFIGDGATGFFRCDLALAPDNAITGNPVFSSFAQVNGGNCKAITSVETSSGVHQLLIGDSRAGKKVLTRDSTFSIFSDGGAVGTGVSGNAYESYAIVGVLTLCAAGQMANANFIEGDYVKVGTQPNISVLFNEIVTAETMSEFELLVGGVQDPPKFFGPSGEAESLYMPRYYFGTTTPGNPNQDPSPAWAKFASLKIDFGTDTVKNECLALTFVGSLWTV